MKSIEKINILLEERGIKATKMMRDLGFSTGLYSQWKAGSQPSLPKLRKVADYLHVPLFAVTDSEYDFGIDSEEVKNIIAETVQEPSDKITLDYTIKLLETLNPDELRKAKKIIEALKGL